MSSETLTADGQLEMLARCRARDEAAWRELYDANFDFVYRTARRLGCSAADAEDVTHDVFLVVHQKLGDFTEGRLTTWLFRITANVVSARHRRARVAEAFSRLRLWVGASPAESPERTAEKTSAARAVERVLSRMAPKKREVLAMFELEGLSGDVIAERLGCPVNTVWTRLHHARQDFVRISTRLGAREDSR
ncbi:MAG: sigma-70 family RNA polymerase sigma factor [Deltaproteobacteria bacterium]|nr:sigma-70 family RNA polymerase sigma factor [Deltaproteobacteria bacterium]